MRDRTILPAALAFASSMILTCGQTGSRPDVKIPKDNPMVPDSASSCLIAPAPDRIHKLFPHARLTREFAEPFPYLAVYDSSGRLIGFQVESDLALTTAEGYAGPVPVRVFLDSAARVLGFDALPCDETPGYLEMTLKAISPRLIGYSPSQTGTPDAVTMATLSSSAIIAAVTGSARRVAQEVVRNSHEN